jgi:hypothetical protein
MFDPPRSDTVSPLTSAHFPSGQASIRDLYLDLPLFGQSLCILQNQNEEL